MAAPAPSTSIDGIVALALPAPAPEAGLFDPAGQVLRASTSTPDVASARMTDLPRVPLHGSAVPAASGLLFDSGSLLPRDPDLDLDPAAAADGAVEGPPAAVNSESEAPIDLDADGGAIDSVSSRDSLHCIIRSSLVPVVGEAVVSAGAGECPFFRFVEFARRAKCPTGITRSAILSLWASF